MRLDVVEWWEVSRLRDDFEHSANEWFARIGVQECGQLLGHCSSPRVGHPAPVVVGRGPAGDDEMGCCRGVDRAQQFDSETSGEVARALQDAVLRIEALQCGGPAA